MICVSLFRYPRMSQSGADSSRRDIRAQTAARRDEDCAAQAARACQDPNMLMVLEATGTDAVSYALDVSAPEPFLSLVTLFFPARVGGSPQAFSWVQDSASQLILRVH